MRKFIKPIIFLLVGVMIFLLGAVAGGMLVYNRVQKNINPALRLPKFELPADISTKLLQPGHTLFGLVQSKTKNQIILSYQITNPLNIKENQIIPLVLSVGPYDKFLRLEPTKGSSPISTSTALVSREVSWVDLKVGDYLTVQILNNDRKIFAFSAPASSTPAAK